MEICFFYHFMNKDIHIYEKLYINVKNMMNRDWIDIGIIEQLDEQWERSERERD